VIEKAAELAREQIKKKIPVTASGFESDVNTFRKDA
jgi:hypothetical protein